MGSSGPWTLSLGHLLNVYPQTVGSHFRLQINGRMLLTAFGKTPLTMSLRLLHVTKHPFGYFYFFSSFSQIVYTLNYGD